MTRTGLEFRAAVVALLVVLLTGCVKRYDTISLALTPADLAGASEFPYPARIPPDKVGLVNGEWKKLSARCLKVRAAMQSERDGISSKNAVTGAIFAGLTAVLALASGLYTTAAGEDAEPAVSAGLALGAGVTTAPTFLYFGSDERETVVGTRIAAIDAGLEDVLRAWAAFNQVDTRINTAFDQEDSAKKEHDRVSNGAECGRLSVGPERDVCEKAFASWSNAKAERSKQVTAWHDATNGLDGAVLRLISKCR